MGIVLLKAGISKRGQACTIQTDNPLSEYPGFRCTTLCGAFAVKNCLSSRPPTQIPRCSAGCFAPKIYSKCVGKGQRTFDQAYSCNWYDIVFCRVRVFLNEFLWLQHVHKVVDYETRDHTVLGRQSQQEVMKESQTTSFKGLVGQPKRSKNFTCAMLPRTGFARYVDTSFAVFVQLSDAKTSWNFQSEFIDRIECSFPKKTYGIARTSQYKKTRTLA